MGPRSARRIGYTRSIGTLKADRAGFTNLLTWGGLRDRLPVAMELSLPENPEKGLILHMTYGVVLFSFIVQGLSIGRIFKSDHLIPKVTIHHLWYKAPSRGSVMIWFGP